MLVRVKYFDEKLPELCKNDKGDLVDLYVSKVFKAKMVDGVLEQGEEVELPYHYEKGDTVIIDFGIGMMFPQDKRAQVSPRSGTYRKYGLLLTNSIGQIDWSYNGDNDRWMVWTYATRDGVINYADRLFQFEVVNRTMQDVLFTKVDHLMDKDRGGFGSTGK